MVFRVKSTGKNKYYGKKGEIIRVRDSSLATALKRKYIYCHPIRYDGLGNGCLGIRPVKGKGE